MTTYFYQSSRKMYHGKASKINYYLSKTPINLGTTSKNMFPTFHPPPPPIIMFVVILAVAIAIGVIMTIVLFLVLILLAVVFLGLLSVLSPASITSFFPLPSSIPRTVSGLFAEPCSPSRVRDELRLCLRPVTGPLGS